MPHGTERVRSVSTATTYGMAGSHSDGGRAPPLMKACGCAKYGRMHSTLISWHAGDRGCGAWRPLTRRLGGGAPGCRTLVSPVCGMAAEAAANCSVIITLIRTAGPHSSYRRAACRSGCDQLLRREVPIGPRHAHVSAKRCTLTGHITVPPHEPTRSGRGQGADPFWSDIATARPYGY
jgi:hypothetical protein